MTKRALIHVLQKYLLNPPVKFLFAVGIGRPGYALLETTGRKSGKPRHTPVGDGRVGRQFWIVAEHGMRASYVRNIERDPRVRLKVRNGLRMTWLTGTAHLLPIDDPPRTSTLAGPRSPRQFVELCHRPPHGHPATYGAY